MRFRILPLEERILLDAAAAIDIAGGLEAQDQGAVEPTQTPDQAEDSSSQDSPDSQSQTQPDTEDNESPTDETIVPDQASEVAPNRLLVLSSDVKDANILKEAALDNVGVIYYDANTTSLEVLTQQISDALNGGEAESIAFISYGQDGEFRLTQGIDVSLANLQGSEELQGFWRDIGDMVQDGGTIDLLACNLADSEQGEALIAYLDTLTETDIAASTDLTGSADHGGDWHLELGNVSADEVYFDTAELAKWSGALDQAYLVKDIFDDPSSQGAFPDSHVELDGILYFFAEDPDHVRELWRSDGTEEGTWLVKDINTVSVSIAENLTVVGDKLFFAETDGVNGFELWTSDGTTDGTVMVKDINPGSANSNPSNFVDIGGIVYFSAENSSSTGIELWKSDGTEAGTVLVKDINAGSGDASITEMTNVNGVLYFVANDGDHGKELWKSDGTEAGTEMVKDIRTGSKSSNPANLLNIDGTLYFSAKGSTGGTELWKSDGTEAGTVLVKDIFDSGNKSSNPSNFVDVDGTLFFRARDGNGNYELWMSDGSEAGTVMVKDIRPGGSGMPSDAQMTNADGTLFFVAKSSNSEGYELWKSDGTEAGTVLVKDINPGNSNSEISSMIAVGDTVYFAATNGSDGVELWKSDGTEAGTVMIQDIATGNASSTPGELVLVGNRIFFSADDQVNGRELWAICVETNEATENTVPGDQDMDEDTDLIFSSDAGNAITVSDPDGDIIRVTISADHGVLSLSQTTGLAFTSGDGENDSTMTFSGIAEDINNALNGLKFDSTDDYSGDATITIVSDDFEADPVESTINVDIEPIADAPDLSAATANGLEDTEIPLTLSAELTDTDGSEMLSKLEIRGIPVGAILSDGVNEFEATNGHTTANILGWDLNNLTILPPLHDSVDFQLTLFAESTENANGDTETNQTAFAVNVQGVADAPNLDFDNAAGDEDTSIPLTISSSLVDPSETLTVTISGIPEGSTLVNNGGPLTIIDGAVTLTPSQLAGLAITPPQDSDQDFSLHITATSNDDGDEATTEGDLQVTVHEVDDEGEIEAPTEVETNEDESFNFGTTITVGDIDDDGGIMTLNVTNGTLNLGDTSGLTSVSGDGSGSITIEGSMDALNDALANLEFVPNEHWSGETTLALTLQGDDQGDEIAEADVVITVTPDADAPEISAADVSGNEDTAIALNISAELVDTDGSEAITTLEIQGIPEGAVLTDGVHTFEATAGNTTANILGWNLNNLTITPPEHSGDDFTLTLSATSTENANGDTATVNTTFDVDVYPVPDMPTLEVMDAEGDEDTFIPLEFLATTPDQDGSESIWYLVWGIPQGSMLESDNGPITITNNFAYVYPADLAGLAIKPPPNSDVDFTLRIYGVSQEAETGGIAYTLENLNVTVNAVADTPNLTLENSSGDEDTDIPLSIAAAVTDTDGSEEITAINVSNIPEGATLSDGVNSVIATDQNQPINIVNWDLNNLTITPVEHDATDFILSVTAVTTESENGDTEETSGRILVTVNAVADEPNLTADNVEGNEDTLIALDIDSSLVDDDGSESLTVTISGFPPGVTLYSGQTQIPIVNGEVTIDPDTYPLNTLAILPPENSHDDFSLTVTATATEAENGDEITTQEVTFDVIINEVDDEGEIEAPEEAELLEDGNFNFLDTITVGDIDDDAGVITLTVENGVLNLGDTSGLISFNGNGTGNVTLEGSIGALNDALNGLTFVPDGDWSGETTLAITLQGDDQGDEIAEANVAITVTPVADTPALEAENVSGNEDSAISLDLSAEVTDEDGSETLTELKLEGIPVGATLSDGVNTFEATQGDTTANILGWNLNNLTITPPEHSDADFQLTLKATSTENENGDTASNQVTFNVTVEAVADAPNLEVQGANGLEDTPIPLNIDASLVDDDGSETLTITIENIPPGVTLESNGQPIIIQNGIAELTPNQLNNLVLNPPENSDVNFTLLVTATATEGNDDSASESAHLVVSIEADADKPDLTVNPASGLEDTAIALDIEAALVDDDGSEALSIKIEDIPAGATLASNGVPITVTNGMAELTPAQLANLTITPPLHDASDFSLKVTATATEADGGDEESRTLYLDVEVIADADKPNLQVTPAEGSEDEAIDLTIAASLVDTDGSETLSIVIENIPEGATLASNGVPIPVSGGIAELTPNQLANLTITPPLHSDVDFTLSVTAIATESEGDEDSRTADLLVVVNPVPDAPELETENASGVEDQPIALTIDAELVDESETLTIYIEDIPAGASLASNGVPIAINGGIAELTPEQLNNLTITPPLHSDVDFTLNIIAESSEGGNSATIEASLLVEVAADADKPDLTTSDASGTEDQPIPLTIDADLVDDDGSETLTITIENIPPGATLTSNSGPITINNGTAELTPADLAGLTITPPLHSDVDFTLSVTATATESDGGDQETRTSDLFIEVIADADKPTLDVQPAEGDEDQPIALTIDVELVDDDGSETLSITIEDIPPGATLASNGNPITITNGTAELTPAQLANLTITPAPGSDVDFTLNIVATATEAENNDTDTREAELLVTVNAVADEPTLEVENAAGVEDQPITLTIEAELNDPDSETLTITIEDIPPGATLLSDGQPIAIVNGVAELTPDQLDNLTITPPLHSDVDFTLTVIATATEDAGGSASIESDLLVTVEADADLPTLEVQPAEGNEDEPIDLDIASELVDDDGSETLSITIENIPDGATLASNGVPITIVDNSATLTPAQLVNLTITPPENSDANFTLLVTATATEDDGGDSESRQANLQVTVNAVADQPNLSVEAATGNEDTPIALAIDASLVDPSETLSIEISDIPAGATLQSGGQSITIVNGVAQVTPAQLADLTITPPENSDVDFTLTVKAISSEPNGSEASAETTLDVTVIAVADLPNLDVAPAEGDEDTPIDLDITSTLADTDLSEVLSMTIDNIPDDAVLTSDGQVIQVVNNSATLTPDQLDNLTITPPENSTDDFTLSITATATEQENNDEASVQADLLVTVNPVNDETEINAPDLVLMAEDTSFALDVTIEDVDIGQGIMTVTFTVENGVLVFGDTSDLIAFDESNPAEVTLRGDLDAINTALQGLLFTPDADYNGPASVNIETLDEGNSQTSEHDIAITVEPVNDAPTIDAPETVGPIAEDTNIIFSGLSVNDIDVDPAVQVLEMTLSAPDGDLTLAAGSGVSIISDDGETIVFQGTLNQLNAAIDGLVFDPDENYNGTTQLNIEINDLGNIGDVELSAQHTVDITYFPVNDFPIVEGPLLELGTEGDSINIGTIQLGDPDLDRDSEIVTITITSAEGNLFLGNPSAATIIDGANGTGEIVLQGTLNDLQTAINGLNGLTFTPPENFNGAGEINFVIDDLGNIGGGNLTDDHTVAIFYEAANDPPTIEAIPSSIVQAEDTNAAFTSIVVGDIDVDPETDVIRLTLSVDNASIILGNASEVSFVSGSDGSGNMVIEGTLNQLNAALVGLQVDPNDNFNGNTNLTLTVDDLGNIGGGSLTAEQIVPIEFTPVNDPPEITAPDQVTLPEDSNLVFSGLSIADIDITDEIVQVTLTATDGIINLNAPGFVDIIDGADGSSYIQFTGTLEDINTVLLGLQFDSTDNFVGTATLQIDVNDLGNVGGGDLTDTHTVDIVYTPVNDPPEVDSPSTFRLLAEDEGTTFTDISFGDLDVDPDTEILQVTITIDHGTLTLGDSSEVTIIPPNLEGTSTLQFTGTLNELTAAVDGLTVNAEGDYTGLAVLNIEINDLGNTGGGDLTDAHQIALFYTAENDAPINNIPVDEQQVNEDSSITFDAGNNNLITINDVDAENQQVEVAITVTNGSVSLSGTNNLDFSNGNGENDITMVFRGTISDINAALNGMTFTADPNYNGPASIEIVTNDLGNTGAGGNLSDTDTINIDVAPVNDAPLILFPYGEQEMDEDGTLTFSQANGNPLLLSDNEGTYGPFIDGDDLSQDQLDSIRLTNMPNQVGPDGENVMRVRNPMDGALHYTWSTPGGESGEGVAPPGDSFLLVPEGSTVSLSIEGDVVETEHSSFGPDPVPTMPFPPSTNDILEVTLSSNNGSLALGSTGGLDITNQTDSTITFSGTVADINAALDGLTYTPDLNYNGPADIQVSTNDVGLLSANASLPISVLAVNDAPTIEGLSGNLSVDQDQPLIFSGDNGNQITITDVDIPPGSPAEINLTLSTDQGSFTLGSLDGLTFISGTGTGDTFLSITGTPEAINLALNGLSFLPSEGFVGEASMNLLVNDLGAQGSGGEMVSGETTGITVNEVNTGGNDFVIGEDGDIETGDDGSFTVPSDISGDDTFSFTVDDSLVNVTLSVEPLTDTEEYGADVPDPAGFQPLGGGAFVNVTKEPRHGDLSLSPDGSFSYLPFLSETGMDSFSFQLGLGTGDSREVSVVVQVVAPEFVHPTEQAFPGGKSGYNIAQNLAYGALTFNTGMSKPTAKGAAQIVVKHDYVKLDEGEPVHTMQVENPSHAAVHTVAAFAIKSKPEHVPTDIDEIHKEEESDHQSLVADALKQLHHDDLDINAG